MCVCVCLSVAPLALSAGFVAVVLGNFIKINRFIYLRLVGVIEMKKHL